MSKALISEKEKFSEYLDIIIERQLLDRELWKKCVDVFSSGIDNADAGWRGEYFGKMMRGACLVYKVSPSEKLLAVLTEAVNALLLKQDEKGRISSYRSDEEFFGWDMWSRKYVMTGLQHFKDICTDEKLNSRIDLALKAHADYIIDNIGKDKTPILQTGSFWGGVNSASILEPFVRMYSDTGDQKYLEFAQYIISTGGCRDGNIIEQALEGKPPYLFAEQKAYETMSFFEGLLAYYEVTGDKKCFDAVCRFTDSMLKTDITAIGGCGCTHELFDNSALAQTEPKNTIMQETCVTVTLIRLLSRLYLLTGEKRLIDTIRLASLNALAGALNVNGYDQFGMEDKKYFKGLVFDSYSPLCDSQRALGIGGFKKFADGSHFGCCACIASAGFALYPLMSVTSFGDGISINYLVDGCRELSTGFGNINVEISGGKITVKCDTDKAFTVRVTEGDDNYSVISACEGKEKAIKNGFCEYFGKWNDGCTIETKQTPALTETVINGKSSFNYGGFTLAADTAKTGVYVPGQKLIFKRDGSGNIIFTLCEPQYDEQIRIEAQTDKGTVTLCDYASAGQNGKSTVTVWF